MRALYCQQHTLLHGSSFHLQVSSIWLNNAAAAEGPCPTPQRLEVLQVDNIDDAALSYLPDAVLKAMAGHVFKMDIVAYHVIPDFDTEELMGGQVGQWSAARQQHEHDLIGQCNLANLLKMQAARKGVRGTMLDALHIARRALPACCSMSARLAVRSPSMSGCALCSRTCQGWSPWSRVWLPSSRRRTWAPGAGWC
jgi:hypothetical protein